MSDIIKICGIDPSIKSTGKTIMELDVNTFDIRGVKYYGYCDTKVRCIVDDRIEIVYVGSKYSTLSVLERQDIAYNVLDIDMEDVKHVSFEGYAFSKVRKASGANSRGMMQLGEFIGTMKHRYYVMGKGIVVYPSTTVKKLATNDGTADKLKMQAQLKHDYPDWHHPYFDNITKWENPCSDIVDSFWICEALRLHMKYDVLGSTAMTEVELAAVQGHTAKSEPITETPILIRSVV